MPSSTPNMPSIDPPQAAPTLPAKKHRKVLTIVANEAQQVKQGAKQGVKQGKLKKPGKQKKPVTGTQDPAQAALPQKAAFIHSATGPPVSAFSSLLQKPAFDAIGGKRQQGHQGNFLRGPAPYQAALSQKPAFAQATGPASLPQKPDFAAAGRTSQTRNTPRRPAPASITPKPTWRMPWRIEAVPGKPKILHPQAAQSNTAAPVTNFVRYYGQSWEELRAQFGFCLVRG